MATEYLRNLIEIHPGLLGDPGTWVNDGYDDDAERLFKITPTATGAATDSPANALEAAYNALPAEGGTLVLHPGTAPYEWDDFSILTGATKPVTVIQRTGAVVVLKDGTNKGLQVRCPMTWVNFQAKFDIAATASGRRFFSLENSAANEAVDFRLVGGKASLAQTNAAIPRFSLISAVGQSSTARTPGLRIEDFTLEIRQQTLAAGSPTQQTNSWSAAEYTSLPHGIGLLYAQYYRDYAIRDVTFRGEFEGAAGNEQYAGLPIVIDDCLNGYVKNLIVENINFAATTGNEALPCAVLVKAVNNESGHCTLEDIRVHSVAAKHAIRTEDAQWVCIEKVRCGQWNLNKTQSIVSASGGTHIEVMRVEGHNINGVRTPASGTPTYSATATQLTGTGIHLGLKVGDYVRALNFNASIDRVYRLTAVATDALTTDPPPPTTVTGNADEQVEIIPFTADCEGVADVKVGDNSQTLRTDAGPLYRFSSCKNVVRSPYDLVAT